MTAERPLSPVRAHRVRRSVRSQARNDAPTTVDDLVGIQAQSLRAAIMAVVVRCLDTTTEDVLGLLERGELVRTWSVRGTLHLIRANDCGMIAGALADLSKEQEDRVLARQGLSEPDVRRIQEAVVATLANHPMTKSELAAKVSSTLGSWVRPWIEDSWSPVLKTLGVRGQLCLVPRGDGDTEFRALVEPPIVSDADAEVALLARYRAGYGPATISDAAAWTGLPRRRVLECLHRAEGTIDLAATVEQLAAHDEFETGESGGPLQLPPFDPLMMGYTESRPLQLSSACPPELISRPGGWISATFLRHDRVVATWKQAGQGFEYSPCRAGPTETELQELGPNLDRLETVVKTCREWKIR